MALGPHNTLNGDDWDLPEVERAATGKYPTKPIICSQGGFAYNGDYIEYWKARALAAEALNKRR